MKKIVVMGSILSASLILTACGKEGQFKSAINKNIENNYQCLRLGFDPMLGGSNFPYDAYKKYRDENTAIVVRMKKDGEFVESSPLYDKDQEAKLNTLVKVGLLKRTEDTQPAIEMFSKKQIEGKSFSIELYNLTKSGEETIKDTGRFSGKEIFCYTHPQVEKVLNYREAKLGGEELAEVKYSYKYTDIAKWAKDKEVQAQFPEIEKTLNDTDKTGVMALGKTNNGWQGGL